MFDFTRIEELRLSGGRHDSPEEGVCFMEMIAFFAGEPHSDRPKCACPMLTAYGIRLNDAMPDDIRNRLLRPLVPLVAGTRDRESEQKRAEFLAMWSVNKVLPIVLYERGFSKEAEACEWAKGLGETKSAAANAARAASYAAAARAASCAAAAAAAATNAVSYAASCAAAAAANAVSYAAASAAFYAAARAAADAASYAAASAAARAATAAFYAAEQIWTIAAEGLRQAILIGRHDGFTVADAVLAERHEALLALQPGC